MSDETRVHTGEEMDGLILTTASTGRRAAAYIIDWILLMVITGGGALVLAIVLYVALAEVQADAAAEVIFRGSFPAMIGLAFFYFVPCWALFGRSLGMLVLGIAVVERDEQRLGGVAWGTAAARALGYLICWITLGFGFFGGLHDSIAGTNVVRVSRPLAGGYAIPLRQPQP